MKSFIVAGLVALSVMGFTETASAGVYEQADFGAAYASPTNGSGYLGDVVLGYDSNGKYWVRPEVVYSKNVGNDISVERAEVIGWVDHHVSDKVTLSAGAGADYAWSTGNRVVSDSRAAGGYVVGVQGAYKINPSWTGVATVKYDPVALKLKDNSGGIRELDTKDYTVGVRYSF